MSIDFRRTAAAVTIFALILVLSPLTALAGPGARLEGLVLDVGGRPASEFRVHLIGDEGTEVAQAATDSRGVYRFGDVPAGEYGLGVENAAGQMAPVAGPPQRLAAGELARRDLKLLSADGPGVDRAARANYSMGAWWAGLTPAAKAWSVVALVVAAGVTVAVLSDDDPASVFEPPAGN